ncbi:MAG: hypothetical protein J6V80_03225 [Clostridia bacterium]|nr:hypothetical protein [Clostridia bacterium]
MKLLIVDNRISTKCERALEKEGFYLLKLPADPSLGEAVASHPDTVLFYADGKIISTADYCDKAAYIFTDIREFKPEIKIHFTDDHRSSLYPQDCIMNALVIGKSIFCKTDSVSKSIIDFAEQRGYKIIHTNQGYPACSVLSFGNNAITADTGMADILTNNGVCVTLISQGSISLPPHQYGFIGGASGVVGNKIYFFGDITKHPDYNIIYNSIINAGYIPVSLSDESLADVGGLVAL